MEPRLTLEAFDHHLADMDLRFEGLIIGGSALVMLGVVIRLTRDVDVLAPEVPEPIVDAARSFAVAQRRAGMHLADDWLNSGPRQLSEALPGGWELRTRPLFQGAALELRTLSRSDLLKTKLFALADRGTDLEDCIALRPTGEEIAEAQGWVELQDGNELWPDHVRETLQMLERRLTHGL